MVQFSNAVGNASVANWWDNTDNQIAFSRGKRGFVAFNGQNNQSLSQILTTGLPSGTYCNVASGSKIGDSCSGPTITVGADGKANIVLSADAPEGFVAIHVDALLPTGVNP